eukprot:TRINITY_DN850_c0_g1_i2.p1 TRINITY_DN850_c0_g1~~TRINITY_DN850_c0_g1_i2.p1  ORF type:complete len:2119 (-),score=466.83 TRINITY_DN850_c0_g1_i2:988-7344(-)
MDFLTVIFEGHPFLLQTVSKNSTKLTKTQQDTKNQKRTKQNTRSRNHTRKNFTKGSISNNMVDRVIEETLPTKDEIVEVEVKVVEVKEETKSVNGVNFTTLDPVERKPDEISKQFPPQQEEVVSEEVISNQDSASLERNLIDLVDKGKVPAIKSLLQRVKININCRSGHKKYQGKPRSTFGWTPLHFATWNDNEEVVKFLIEQGADVNLMNNVKQAPLHIAAYKNSTKAASVLISNGADVNIENPRRRRQLPIHLACIRGNAEMVELLLNNGSESDVVVDNHSGVVTPIFFALKFGRGSVLKVFFSKEIQLDLSSQGGYSVGDLLIVGSSEMEVVDTALGYISRLQEKNPNRPIFNCLGNLINRSIYVGRVDLLEVILKYDSIRDWLKRNYISSHMYQSSSPLTAAVQTNNAQLLQLIMQKKIDTLQSNLNHALLEAVKLGNSEMVEELCKNGADVNYYLKSTNPQYPGEFVASNGTVLHVACSQGNASLLRLLLSLGVNNEVKKEVNMSGMTALHFVSSLSQSEEDYKPNKHHQKNGVVRSITECLEILVKEGKMDVNSIDKNGNTPLHIAVESGRQENVEKLVELGATLDVKNTKRQGLTPLHICASKGNDTMVRYLVESKANINETKSVKQGPQNALQMAKASGYKRTEMLLLQLGAIDTNTKKSVNVNTQVQLLAFNDNPPETLNYPDNIIAYNNNLELKLKQTHSYEDSYNTTNQKQEDSISSSTSSSSWRTVRLFISSTFADMQAERNYLVKYVIPLLRSKCTKRRIHLIEVDLRWGVTEEQAKQGNTVEICLSEIDKCMIFTALIGDRYGWAPNYDEIRDDLKVKYDITPGNSITAMEINYGALKRKNDPSCHASFYFRDSSFVSKIPDKTKASLFRENNTANASKLEELKKEIRTVAKGTGSTPVFPVFDYKPSYQSISTDGVVELSDLKQFGDAFLDNVWKAIDKEFPEDMKQLSEFDEENFLHDQFIEHRIANFVGRKDKLKELKKYVDTNNPVSKNHPLCVAGQAGSGKSALTAFFSTQMKDSSSVICISHFVGASPKSTDIIATLKRISQSLIREFSLWESVPDEIEYVDLIELFKKLLNLSSKQLGSKKLVIVIDAINQFHNDKHRASQLEWLPNDLPLGVRIIVSCLGGECLDIITSRNYHTIKIGDLSSKDREDIVKYTLQRHNKRLDTNEMKLLMSKSDAVKPLYLVLVCEELRIYGIFEKIKEKISNFSPTLQGVLEQVLIRLENEHGKKIVSQILSLLQTSRHGLLELELLEMLNLNSSSWAALYLSLGMIFRPVGREGQLDFFHRQISKAIRKRYLSEEESIVNTHKMLAKYYLSQIDPTSNYLFNFDNKFTDTTENFPRALNEVVYHLVHGNMWSELEQTLANLYFIERRISNGQVFALVSDFNEFDNYITNNTNNVVNIPMSMNKKLSEYKRFLQGNASHLHLQRQGTLQAALNQLLSEEIEKQSKVIIEKQDKIKSSSSSSTKQPYIKWLNKPPVGDVGYLLQIQASMDVNDCCYSLDQKYVLSAQRDGSLSLWSSITGESAAKIMNHKGIVNSCEFSKDGKKFLSTGEDGLLNIYESDTKQLLTSIKHTAALNSGNFSPCGNYVAAGSEDGSINIYSMKDWKKQYTLNHGGSISCVEFSPDTTESDVKLVSASSDKQLIIWNVLSKEVIHKLQSHTKSIKDCKYDSTGQWLISSGQDMTIKVWNTKTGELLQTLTGHKDNVEGIAISPCNLKIVSGSWDRSVKLWQRSSSTTFDFSLVGEYPGTTHFVNAVSFSHDGKFVLAGSPEHTVKVYEVHALKSQQHSAKPSQPCKIHSKMVRGITCNRKANLLATGSWDRTAKIFSVHIPRKSDRYYHDNSPYLKLISAINGHSKRVNEVKLTSNGKYLITTSMDCTSRLWDVQTREQLLEFRGHSLNVFAVDVTHDDKYIATGSADGYIKLWDIETGEEVGNLHGHRDWVTAIAFSPYSRRLLTGSRDSTIRVWSTESGNQIETLEEHKNCVLQIKYSSDGKYFISASEDKTIKIWDAFSLKCIHTLSGHTHEVTACAFSPNNKYIISGSSDKSVRIWESDTGKLVLSYFGDGGVIGIDVNYEGYIMAGDSGGMVSILEVNNLDMVTM